MNLIEKNMIHAINHYRNWQSGNTRVEYVGDDFATVYLHNNEIGYFDYVYGKFVVNKDTLSRWPTATTKSRLRALGVDVYTKNHITYLNGEAI